MSTAALAGIKVLDFSWALVGGLTTKQLGDHGALVVKVESRGRPCLTRIDRQVSASRSGNPDDKPWFAHLNSSKLSLQLDLKHPGARPVLERLIDWADVVVENFSPGTMQKLGLDYETLAARRPELVMVSGSVYGQTGPHAQSWGIDGTGAALSGRLLLTGWPDRDPVAPGVPYGDVVLPLLMASAVVAALERRSRTGEGCHIDASMFEVQVQQLLPEILAAQLGATEPARAGNRVPDAAPHGVFPVAGDDEWIAIEIWSDEEWRALCDALGCPQLAARHPDLAARKAAEDEIEREIATRTRSAEPLALLERLQRADVAAGLVQDARDLVERDPQLRARQFLVPTPHAELGPFGHQAPPYRLSATPARLAPAPRLGEHTRRVCIELLGFSGEEWERLAAAGVFT